MEFIETLYVKNGNILNLDYHLERMERTAKHFKWKVPSSKFQVISSKWRIENGELRVRVTYDEKGIKNIEYFPIKKRSFKKFKLVEIDFDYSFKYKNRNIFQNILHTWNSELGTWQLPIDEFILIKNHLITDTTISNLAFYTGSEWLTPKYPLLKGTKREELLKKGVLKETNIHTSDLKYFKKMAMLNAIVGFYEIEDFDIIR